MIAIMKKARKNIRPDSLAEKFLNAYLEDDRNYISEIVKATCKELAVQKPKHKKQL